MGNNRHGYVDAPDCGLESRLTPCAASVIDMSTLHGGNRKRVGAMGKQLFQPILIGLMLVAGGFAGTAQAHCVAPILAAERELGIPSGLLLAVALVESGYAGAPSPYAVRIGRKAVYADSAVEAARHLRDAKGAVRSNVTIGCMQLSPVHHRAHFQPLERIADPVENVRHAARYLVSLHTGGVNWDVALRRYNGGKGIKGRNYRCKVHRALTSLGADTARLIDSSRCRDHSLPVVSAETRRLFRQSINPTS